MKKDLQDRAIANEREYFEDRVSKNKIDLSNVIQWIKPSFEADTSLNHFTAFSKGTFPVPPKLISSVCELIIPLIVHGFPLDIPLRRPSLEQLPERFP